MTGDVAESEAVEVIYALPDKHWTVRLRLPRGATVADALVLARMNERVPGLDISKLGLGIFGHKVTPETVLADGDRIELLRPLLADPKQARRRRQAQSGDSG